MEDILYLGTREKKKKTLLYFPTIVDENITVYNKTRKLFVIFEWKISIYRGFKFCNKYTRFFEFINVPRACKVRLIIVIWYITSFQIFRALDCEVFMMKYFSGTFGTICPFSQ